MSEKNQEKFLERKHLANMALGQIIGAGVMVMSIQALGITGRSVNIAFLIAALFSIVAAFPTIFVSSMMVLKGGIYTQNTIFVGEKFAGFTQTISLLSTVSISMYAISLTSYISMIFPQIIPFTKVFSVGFLLLFVVINYQGVRMLAKVQSFIFKFLLSALAIFTIFGIPQVDISIYFTNELFNQPFMSNGVIGLLEASAFLTFATGGAAGITVFSSDAKNPQKDIPFIIIFVTVGVAVLYAFMATVIGGILPANEVIQAGNLAPIAFQILPLPLYYFFLVFGAIFAIGSAMNSMIAASLRPMATACKDGWFPNWLGKLHPTTGVPVGFLAVITLINITVILLGIDVSQIGKWVLIISNVLMFISSLSVIKLPKLFPEAWKRSPFYVPNPILYTMLILTAASLSMQAFLNLRGLSIEIIIFNIVTACVIGLYILLRHKSGKVNMTASYEIVV